MTVVERGQRMRVTLDGMGRLGEAMAEVEGKPVFVFGGIPGEEVEVEVIRERRNYVAAEVVEVLKPSPYRVEPRCHYFGQCTGCQWQHVDYQRQLEMKRLAVVDALSRVGGLSDITVLPTLPSPEQFGYRNHARFTIGRREGVLGFVHREKRRFVEIDKCLLMAPWINVTLGKLRGHCSETSQLAIRYGTQSGDWLIQPTLHDAEVPLATGQKHYRDVVNGASFRVSSPSFFQVNTPQTECMVDLLRVGLKLSGNEIVVDAYAGVGTFAALLAPYASRVIGIEESASAIEDTKENLASFQNVMILKGKTEEVLGELDEEVDAVVLDPPRVGCQRVALDLLMKLAPSTVAYVSCDPESLARDLKILVAGPYRIETVQPLDMFPQTYHVECIATLTLKAGFPITLASSSPRRRSILEDAGIPFSIVPPHADEAEPEGSPEEYVRGLALAKAKQAAGRVRRGLVLAADTTVVDGDTMLGKPKDAVEALEMLRRLRGKRHCVMTGVVVLDAASGKHVTGVETSWVKMRSYTDGEAQAFVASGGAADKAGAYAVQDEVFSPAESVEGCYPNVVGLPLCLTVDLLRQLGADVGDVFLPEHCLVDVEGGVS